MVAALNMFWSLNRGVNWTRGTSGHADHHSHAYLNGNGGDDILIGSDGGVTLHTFSDPNKISRINQNYKVTQFYAGNFGPNGDSWIGGTQDNGTHRNINSTHAKVFGSDGGYSHISQQNPNLAYFSTQGGYIYRSTNYNSDNWNDTRKLISSTAMHSEGANFINQHHMNLADGAQLYNRTTQGLWRTIDSGTTWTKIGTLPGIHVITSSIEVNPVLYFGRSSSRIYRIDSAATTSSMGEIALEANRPPEANGGTVLGIAVHPTNRNTIFITYSNNSNSPRIWKIEHCDEPNNLVWTNVSGDLPTGLPVNDIALHPQAPDSILFAATDFGLYYSTDFGTSWKKETNIPNATIFKIEMRASDNHAFLFTHGRGVWRITASDLNQSTSIRKIEKINFSVSPNPIVHGVFKINLTKENAKSMICILDLQGKIVKEWAPLSNKTIDVSHLKSGMYIVNVISEYKKGTQKILISN